MTDDEGDDPSSATLVTGGSSHELATRPGAKQKIPRKRLLSLAEKEERSQQSALVFTPRMPPRMSAQERFELKKKERREFKAQQDKIAKADKAREGAT
jgi:hypothetical protein